MFLMLCFHVNPWHLVWASPFSSFIQWTESIAILLYIEGPTSCSKGCTQEDFEPSPFGWVQLRSTQKSQTPTIGYCICWYNCIVWTTLISTSHVYVGLGHKQWTLVTQMEVWARSFGRWSWTLSIHLKSVKTNCIDYNIMIYMCATLLIEN